MLPAAGFVAGIVAFDAVWPSLTMRLVLDSVPSIFQGTWIIALLLRHASVGTRLGSGWAAATFAVEAPFTAVRVATPLFGHPGRRLRLSEDAAWLQLRVQARMDVPDVGGEHLGLVGRGDRQRIAVTRRVDWRPTPMQSNFIQPLRASARAKAASPEWAGFVACADAGRTGQGVRWLTTSLCKGRLTVRSGCAILAVKFT